MLANFFDFLLNVKRRFYGKKSKNGKAVRLEINPEETMEQITEKIQDKGGIRPCHVSLTKIDTGCYCEILVCKSFS